MNLPRVNLQVAKLDSEIDAIGVELEDLKEKLLAAQNEDLSDPDEKVIKGADLVRATLAIDKKRIEFAALVESLKREVAETEEVLASKIAYRNRLLNLREQVAEISKVLTTFGDHMNQARLAWKEAQELIKSDLDLHLCREIYGPHYQILNRIGKPVEDCWIMVRPSDAGNFIVSSPSFFADYDNQKRREAAARAREQAFDED